jgi:hypothetical protein
MLIRHFTVASFFKLEEVLAPNIKFSDDFHTHRKIEFSTRYQKSDSDEQLTGTVEL